MRSVILVFGILCALAAPESYAQNSIDDALNDLYDRLLSLEHKVADESTTQAVDVHSLKDEVATLGLTIQKLESAQASTASALSAQVSSSTKRGMLEAILLILGLLCEILGGTLLAANHLADELHPVYRGKVEATISDMQFKPVNTEQVVAFYAYIGVLLLVLGFVLQLAGTAIILELSLPFVLAIVGVGVVAPSAILIVMLGQTPEQSRAEKLTVICKNIIRIFISPPLTRLLRSRRVPCDVCLRYLKVEKGQVWYLSENNNPPHNYLYVPMFFHFGHPHCLGQIDVFEDRERRLRAGLSTSEARIVKEDYRQFLGTTLPTVRNFMDGYRRYWESVRQDGTIRRKQYTEVELDDMERKLKHAGKRADRLPPKRNLTNRWS